MPLPEDFEDEDRNYRVRVCIRVEDNPIVGFLTGSVVDVCVDCGEAIWVDLKQPLPPLPEGMEAHGDLLMCIPCLKNRSDGQPLATLTEQTAEALRNMGMDASDPLT